ncbi:hypothetical protein FA13DRAFT_1742424 [Coprinellus micaceus]|uniref:Uncharacterized protein n=1 Tax=Coprinellus micaceus TaxID=71717 RepID=A0A4Y7SGP8_COPMI|nr:hypothetical protein FA13DRAFT_1742424 [Coprinellus micaceus]
MPSLYLLAQAFRTSRWPPHALGRRISASATLLLRPKQRDQRGLRNRTLLIDESGTLSTKHQIDVKCGSPYEDNCSLSEEDAALVTTFDLPSTTSSQTPSPSALSDLQGLFAELVKNQEANLATQRKILELCACELRMKQEEGLLSDEGAEDELEYVDA